MIGYEHEVVGMRRNIKGGSGGMEHEPRRESSGQWSAADGWSISRTGEPEIGRGGADRPFLRNVLLVLADDASSEAEDDEEVLAFTGIDAGFLYGCGRSYDPDPHLRVERAGRRMARNSSSVSGGRLYLIACVFFWQMHG